MVGMTAAATSTKWCIRFLRHLRSAHCKGPECPATPGHSAKNSQVVIERQKTLANFRMLFCDVAGSKKVCTLPPLLSSRSRHRGKFQLKSGKVRRMVLTSAGG